MCILSKIKNFSIIIFLSGIINSHTVCMDSLGDEVDILNSSLKQRTNVPDFSDQSTKPIDISKLPKNYKQNHRQPLKKEEAPSDTQILEPIITNSTQEKELATPFTLTFRSSQTNENYQFEDVVGKPINEYIKLLKKGKKLNTKDSQSYNFGPSISCEPELPPNILSDLGIKSLTGKTVITETIVEQLKLHGCVLSFSFHTQNVLTNERERAETKRNKLNNPIFEIVFSHMKKFAPNTANAWYGKIYKLLSDTMLLPNEPNQQVWKKLIKFLNNEAFLLFNEANNVEENISKALDLLAIIIDLDSKLNKINFPNICPYSYPNPFRTGIMYLYGINGTQRDLQASIFYLAKAYDYKCEFAYKYLAQAHYLYGMEFYGDTAVQRNLLAAMHHFSVSADLKYELAKEPLAEAQRLYSIDCFDFGMNCLHGTNGVQKDFPAAIHWLTISANFEYEPAIEYLTGERN